MQNSGKKPIKPSKFNFALHEANLMISLRTELHKELENTRFDAFTIDTILKIWLPRIFYEHLDQPETRRRASRELLSDWFELIAIKSEPLIECFVSFLITDEDTLTEIVIAEKAIEIVDKLIRLENDKNRRKVPK